MDNDTFARLAYLVLLLLAVGGWVFAEYRGRMGFALRTALAWGMIFVGIAAGYGLWTDLRHDIAPRQMVSDTGTITVPRSPDGHYYVTLTVNGEDLRFMADTGATNMVLSQADARRLGIDPESLNYIGEAMTANGTVRTARVRLPEVALGPFRDNDVAAWVTEGEMDISLLGMDYLRTFRVELAGDEMILTR